MKQLKVNLKNCYGINNLEKDFDFSNGNTFAIYAPNGTMKTSFTKSFKQYQAGQEYDIKDLIFGEKSSHDITIDNIKIDKDDIFTIGSLDEKYQSKKITNLLLDEKLKEDFYEVLDLKFEFLTKLNKKTGLAVPKKKTDRDDLLKTSKLEEKFLKDFGIENKNFLDELLMLKLPAKNTLNVEYKSIFDNSTLEKLIISETFQKNISAFIQKSKEIYGKKDKNDNKIFPYLEQDNFSFGKFKDVQKNLSGNNFFVKDNKVILNGIVKNKTELKTELENIETELKTSDEFVKISDELNKNKKSQKLLSILENNISIISELLDYNNFRKKLWSQYLQEIKDENDENLFELLKTKYELLKSKITSDKLDNTKWKEAVDIFNDRFSMPFSMNIGNLKNSIFGDTPIVEFTFYKDGDKENNSLDNISKKDKNSILESLSQGEKRALYLLNIIFDIEHIRQEIENPDNDIKQKLLIIDDIADSFDYKNKYAIIEYLRDIAEYEIEKDGEKIKPFYSIILTHNFDFFRTVQSRIIGRNRREIHSLYIQKEESKIHLIPETYKKEPFQTWKENLTEQNIIALIPFVRNLIEYGKNEQKHFILLTHLLHKKEALFYSEDGNVLRIENDKIVSGPPENREIIREYNESEDIGDFTCKKTEEITFKDIEGIYQDYLGIDGFSEDISGNYIYEKIIIFAEDPLIKNNPSLENKIILAIAIRFKSEEFMIREIRNMNFVNYKITQSQTSELINKYKKKFNREEHQKDVFRYLDSVNIITPENIHINSFMYEPILDMGMEQLTNLYKNVKGLSNDN